MDVWTRYTPFLLCDLFTFRIYRGGFYHIFCGGLPLGLRLGKNVSLELLFGKPFFVQAPTNCFAEKRIEHRKGWNAQQDTDDPKQVPT